MPTAAVAALNWLVNTSNTAVAGSANAGPDDPEPLVWARTLAVHAVAPPPEPLVRAWIQLPSTAGPRREPRIAARASLMNLRGLALPAAAGGGQFLSRYLAPLYERIRYRRE